MGLLHTWCSKIIVSLTQSLFSASVVKVERCVPHALELETVSLFFFIVTVHCHIKTVQWCFATMDTTDTETVEYLRWGNSLSHHCSTGCEGINFEALACEWCCRHTDAPEGFKPHCCAAQGPLLQGVHQTQAPAAGARWDWSVSFVSQGDEHCTVPGGQITEPRVTCPHGTQKAVHIILGLSSSDTSTAPVHRTEWCSSPQRQLPECQA